MKLRRRHPFTLIETLIALALTALVVSFLTYFFHQISLLNQKGEELQQKSFKMRYIENRLSQVIPRIVEVKTPSKDFYFFTAGDPNGLIFTYDNFADKNKAFGNHVLGRLFVGEDHNLYLATWPSPRRWAPLSTPPMKLEMLMAGVSDMQIEYFVPPDKGWKPNFVDPAQNQTKQTIKTDPKNPTSPKTTPTVNLKPSEEGAWTKEWRQEYQLLPGLLRLQFKVGKEVWQYVFPIPETERQVVYS